MATWLFSSNGYGYVFEEDPERKPVGGISTRGRKMTSEEVEEAIRKFWTPPVHYTIWPFVEFLMSLNYHSERKE